MKIEELQRQLEQGLAKLRAPEYKSLQPVLRPLIPTGFHACVTLSDPEQKKKNASAEGWSPKSGTILIQFEPDRDFQDIEPELPPTVASPKRLTKKEQVFAMLRQPGGVTLTEIMSEMGWRKHTTVSFLSKGGEVGKAGLKAERFKNERGETSYRFTDKHTAKMRDNEAKQSDRARSATRSAPNPIEDLVRALDRAESRPGFEFVALKWFRDTALVEEGFPWAQPESARQSALRDAIANRLILTNRIENPRSPQFPVTTVRLNRLLPQVQTILRGSGQGREDFEPAAIRGEPLSTTILRDRR